MTALRNILLALSIGVIMWMASCSNNGCEENSSSLPVGWVLFVADEDVDCD